MSGGTGKLLSKPPKTDWGSWLLTAAIVVGAIVAESLFRPRKKSDILVWTDFRGRPSVEVTESERDARV